ncbi:MAG: Rieske 2Fe-2S domain-containing protein [Myxococcales bacterium]|nr:Rieske 2Fe-2S domain-containing protein [Myxococcales bacterium]
MSGDDDPIQTIPAGWYCVSFSHELAPGQVRRVHYFKRELVLYRTRAGRARLVDAHCPHLGAHLGRGGRSRARASAARFTASASTPRGPARRSPAASGRRSSSDSGPGPYASCTASSWPGITRAAKRRPSSSRTTSARHGAR